MVLPNTSARKLSFSSLEVHGQDASSLFGLSGELRNRIYRLVLLEQDPIPVGDVGHARPCVLATCQQITKESTAIFYEENVFAITIYNYNSRPLYEFAREMDALFERGHPVSPIVRLDVQIKSPNWNNVIQWLKHVSDDHTPDSRMLHSGFGDRHPQSRSRADFTTVRAMFTTVEAFKGKASWGHYRGGAEGASQDFGFSQTSLGRGLKSETRRAAS